MKKDTWRHNWNEGATADKQQYLDNANKMPAVQHYKQQSFNMMAIKQGQQILDVGCGTGDDAIALAQMVGKTGKVVGLDVEKGLIEKATERALALDLNIEFYQADIYHIDINALNTDGKLFDSCRSDRVLQHLKYPLIALLEMVKILKSGGKLVISEPDWETRVVDSPDERVLTRTILNYWADTRRSGWIGHQLPALFKQCGLINIEVEPVSISGCMQSYDWDMDFIGLVKSAEGAKDDGLITPTQADLWLRNLKEAEQVGCFFAHLGGFVVKGEKP